MNGQNYLFGVAIVISLFFCYLIDQLNDCRELDRSATIKNNGCEPQRLITKELVYTLKVNESIRLKSNNGTKMLLRILNTSNFNSSIFYYATKDEYSLHTLKPNKVFSLINDWKGSQILIANVTTTSSTKITVMLVGNSPPSNGTMGGCIMDNRGNSFVCENDFFCKSW
jgi:hypothetical protein